MNKDSAGYCKSINILLVEDNPADIELAKEALSESKLLSTLHTVPDGEAAMYYLHRQGQYKNAVRPDLIILDLNLPKKDGREVLKAIKEDEHLKSIPVVILTMSKDEADMLKVYNLHANCFITKPIDFTQFISVVRAIENFWFTIVCLPPKPDKEPEQVHG
ncbi:MAG: response regulator [Endomicrobiales bacterium]|jgi:two-component system response regulator